jgi:hypothetical protein
MQPGMLGSHNGSTDGGPIIRNIIELKEGKAKREKQFDNQSNVICYQRYHVSPIYCYAVYLNLN